MEQVILVDTDDNELGTMEKMEAHRAGSLHRAFSVVLFDSKGEILLQKRAQSKYHSGGLWTNACCSHPFPGEALADATQRKLFQELGIRPALEFAFKFIYRTKLDNGLIEHEIDHVFTGTFDGNPEPNPSEAEDWKFAEVGWVRSDMLARPEAYTHWFRLIFNHPALAVPGH